MLNKDSDFTMDNLTKWNDDDEKRNDNKATNLEYKIEKDEKTDENNDNSLRNNWIVGSVIEVRRERDGQMYLGM